MRVVIVGAGRAGISVATHLRRMNHEVVIVDRDETQSRRAFELHGLVAFTGDATHAALLRDAEVGRADVVVALLRRDADNLAVAMLAKEAGAGRTMVRMREAEYRPIYVAAGVHRILSETDVFIGALATGIEHEAVHNAMVLGAGESVAIELSISPESRVVGTTVSEIAKDPFFPSSCVLAGLFEPSGKVEAPRGSSLLTRGMTVLLVVSREELSRAVEFFTGKKKTTAPTPLVIRDTR